MAKKRTARKRVALATTRKRALTIAPAVETATEQPVAPQVEPDVTPEVAPEEPRPAPAAVEPEQPPQQAESSTDPEVWDELNQHIVDIERNLGELRESMRAHDLIEAIEPVLMEIKNDVEAGRAKSELTAVGLDQIREDLSELHSQLVAVGRIGLRTEAQVDDLVGRMEVTEPETPFEYPDIPTVPIWERPPALLTAGAVVLTISALLYLQTGNLKLALGVLVAANLLGCTTILVARKL